MRAGRKRNVRGIKTQNRAYRQEEDEGTNRPIFEPKLRRCTLCRELTPNYYKCGTCHFKERYSGRDFAEIAEGFDG